MARADVTTTNFPKMGDSLAENLVNMSGQRSPYTKMVPKKTMGRGASPTGVAGHRSGYMIKEAHGPCFRIKSVLYKQNAAEASATLSNTRMMRVAVPREDRVGSASDFWTKRQYGQRV